jgi:hypothetical protein
MRRLLVNFISSLFPMTFPAAGFTWEQSDHLEGWISRDPHNDDWILWSTKSKQMYRRANAGRMWRPSPESEKECMKLGLVYAELVGIR